MNSTSEPIDKLDSAVTPAAASAVLVAVVLSSGIGGVVVQVWPPLERILCSAADTRRAYLLLSLAAQNTRRCATFGPRCAAGRLVSFCYQGTVVCAHGAPTRLRPVPGWALRVHASRPKPVRRLEETAKSLSA